MDAEIVKQLIISRRALPMPDDFSLLLDSMYFWGRSVSFHWYRKTLELINFYLRHGNLNRANLSSTDLYCDVIRIRILQRIFMRFPAGGNPTLYNAWSAHYQAEVKRGLTDFFELAVSSFHFLNNELTNLQVGSHYHAELAGTVVSMD
jgi:hypothetical protein